MLKSFKQLLRDELGDDLSDGELSLIPSGYQRIGDVIILNLKEELWKFDDRIGKFLLEEIPNVRTVCRRTGGIIDQTRKPRVKVITGDGTETVHKEHGISYKLDVKEIMFSKGNLFERKRISELVKEGETIVDMFAGIGYFSLGIAKFSNPKEIYSIEMNPIAYRYLRENVRINRVGDKIIPIFGDCKEKAPLLGRIADRIIMGLLPSSKEYLPTAMKIVKDGGTIHYHGILRKSESHEKLLKDVNEVTRRKSFELRLTKYKKVKSYAPKVDHVVLDCEIFS